MSSFDISNTPLWRIAIFRKNWTFGTLGRACKNGKNDCGGDHSRVLISVSKVEPKDIESMLKCMEWLLTLRKAKMGHFAIFE